MHLSAEGVVIDYDKCLVCGACYRECGQGALTVENLGKVVLRMQSLGSYRQRIQLLESEKARLAYRAKWLERSIKGVVENMPLAAFIVDSWERITVYNQSFAQLLPPDLTDFSSGKMELRTKEIGKIFPLHIIELYRRRKDGGFTGSEISTLDGKKISVSIYPTPEIGITVMIISDLTQGDILRGEISARLRAAIDRKMEMVQKIGFLLGEELSAVAQEINSVIDILDNDATS